MSIPPIGRSFEAIRTFFQDDSNIDNTQTASANFGNVGLASVGGSAVSTILGINEVGKRPLTGEERQIVEEYFGESIDLERVTINEFSIGANANGLFNDNSRPYVTGNTVNYSKPIDLDNPLERATFLHEMTHVWQYQNTKGPGVQRDGAVFEAGDFFRDKEDRGQQYILNTDDLKNGNNFHDFNIEQQAEIVRGYDLLQQHAELNSELEAVRWGRSLSAEEIREKESAIQKIEGNGLYQQLTNDEVKPHHLEEYIEEIKSHRPTDDGIAYEANEAFDEIINSPTPGLEIVEGVGEVGVEVVESAGENIWDEGKEVYDDLTTFPWGRVF